MACRVEGIFGAVKKSVQDGRLERVPEDGVTYDTIKVLCRDVVVLLTETWIVPRLRRLISSCQLSHASGVALLAFSMG
jgi:hypothetical protein